MNKITVITPTGDRPVPFSLCRRWMSLQTLKPDQWIIIDDGKTPMFIPDLQPYEQYVRRQPRPDDPKHTLVVNIATALPLIKGDVVFFCEDDEYYEKDYLREMVGRFDGNEVLGIGWAKYYHLPTGGYIEHKNMEHSSLAQTAFKMSSIGLVKKCVDRGMEKEWLDCQIWDEVKKSKSGASPIKALIFKDDRKPLYVGMKGLPGRFGIGVGHKASTYPFHDPADRPILKRWVREHHQVYLDILKGEQSATKPAAVRSYNQRQ